MFKNLKGNICLINKQIANLRRETAIIKKNKMVILELKNTEFEILKFTLLPYKQIGDDRSKSQ